MYTTPMCHLNYVSHRVYLACLGIVLCLGPLPTVSGELPLEEPIKKNLENLGGSQAHPPYNDALSPQPTPSIDGSKTDTRPLSPRDNTISNPVRSSLDNDALQDLFFNAARSNDAFVQRILNDVEKKHLKAEVIIEEYRQLTAAGEVDCKTKEQYAKQIGALIDSSRMLISNWVSGPEAYGKAGVVKGRETIKDVDRIQSVNDANLAASLIHREVHIHGGSSYPDANTLEFWREKLTNEAQSRPHECFDETDENEAGSSKEELAHFPSPFDTASPYNVGSPFSELSPETLNQWADNFEGLELTDNHCQLIQAQIAEIKRVIIETDQYRHQSPAHQRTYELGRVGLAHNQSLYDRMCQQNEAPLHLN